MKLRNRQNGKIYTLSDDLYIEYTQNGRIELKAIISGGNMSYYYDSLDKLYYEWEDYKPAEPLIKDEKIRKAVRAWAEANGIEESRYRNVKFDHSEHRLKWVRTIIEFDSIEGLENLDDGREYTIEELCGSEE